MVTNRRARLSRRSAIKRLKDSTADLLLPDFHFSPVAFLSQGWSLQLNDLSLSFFSTSPIPKTGSVPTWGLRCWLFELSWANGNKGSKYGSKPLHETTWKRQHEAGRRWNPSELKGSASRTHPVRIAVQDFSNQSSQDPSVRLTGFPSGNCARVCSCTESLQRYSWLC